jgi:hypothetical protein
MYLKYEASSFSEDGDVFLGSFLFPLFRIRQIEGDIDENKWKMFICDEIRGNYRIIESENVPIRSLVAKSGKLICLFLHFFEDLQ